MPQRSAEPVDSDPPPPMPHEAKSDAALSPPIPANTPRLDIFVETISLNTDWFSSWELFVVMAPLSI